MTDSPSEERPSAYDIVDEVIRNLGRYTGSFNKVSDLASAYRVASTVGEESAEGSELLRIVDSAGRIAWDASVLGASVALRLAGARGDALDQVLRGSVGGSLSVGPQVIDIGDVHLSPGADDEAQVINVPIQVVNQSFYEEGRVSFTCSEFIGPGPINKPVLETRLPAYTRFNPSHFPNVESKDELTTIMTVHIANTAETGYYKALVQALPLDSWTVVSLRVR